MNKDSKIYVAGHNGLVGRAVIKAFKEAGYSNVITRAHRELDLTRQNETEHFFESENPDYVILAAARVGGIGANSTFPAEFFYENTAIALNVIHAAYKFNVKKLLNLGSSCIYPKMAPQPLKEEYLLTGPLEPTNEAYAVAKIAAIRMCKHYNQQYGTNFLSVMPTNLYGPGDNYDLNTSHVLPALIRKFHEAKINGGPVKLWGDGTPLREFLYSEDLADALLFLLEKVNAEDIAECINVGTGVDQTIRSLADMIANVVGYSGDIEWDRTKPNGTPRKLMDVSRIHTLGWKATTALETGLQKEYEDFLKNNSNR